VHCQDIRFDFTRFVDSGFKSFMTNYLPLSIMHEFLMVFLLEGQLGLYRYLYSTLRNHKEFIKELNKDKIGQEPRGVSMIDDITADDQADALKQVEARAQTQTNYLVLHEWAMKNPLKSGEVYNFST
jgi:hypothetical protein